MIFVQSISYSGDANTCCREGALEGRNHFGIRPKKVKAVFKMTADFKFGITEHLHKEFYNCGQKRLGGVLTLIPILMISQVGVLL